jgi:hypothetical protein
VIEPARAIRRSPAAVLSAAGRAIFLNLDIGIRDREISREFEIGVINKKPDTANL